MTDLPDERTAPSKRQAPDALEPGEPGGRESGERDALEQTAPSRRQTPIETTAPSRRQVPAEETVISERARSRSDGVDEWTVRTADARSTGVIRPAPDAGGAQGGDTASRSARRPGPEADVYSPRPDTAARVPRTAPASQPQQPVVDAARVAAERRRRTRRRAVVTILAAALTMAAAVVAVVALLTLPA
ncbi:hypothetical protein [Microbacterium invictum]|uniref:Uncharacterized protein n=1 Tax=Microbacterium invictum TaxID=515415 RepID=A0ABZ0V9R7_9MICO|nr:hypothetical protein [Microbacterium invictum]WQB69999.1 hypothetical protein T9R20_15065 [Microbacterium invictum]